MRVARITRAQAVLPVLIQTPQHALPSSPKTGLSHPRCKVFTASQLVLLLGGSKEMQTRLIERDADGHLATSLLAGARLNCQRAVNVLPE